MTFKEILPYLKNGKKIKLPEWKGYWQKSGATVFMFCKDGRILNINGGMDDGVFFTLDNIVRDDWELADDDLTIKEE